MRSGYKLELSAEGTLKLCFILYPIIVWSVLSGGAMTSNLFYALIFSVLLLFALSMRNMQNDLLVVFFTMAILSFFSVLMSAMDTGASLSLKALVNYFSFLLCMGFILFCSTYPVDYIQNVRTIYNLGLIAAMLYPIAFFLFRFDVNANLFSMNFSNPNLTGMFLFQGICYCILNFFSSTKMLKKIISFVIFSFDCWLLLLTEARNCIIALFLVAVIVLLCGVFKFRFSKVFCFFMSVFPLVFAGIYTYFNLWIVSSGRFAFLEAEGKTLTSRVYIWGNILQELRGKLFFGSYFRVGGNAHNSHLSILASFGIIVLFLSVWFLYQVMRRTSQVIESKQQLVCFAMFCGTIFIGMAEGSLFVGALGLFVPACSFLLLARIEN